MASSSQSVGLFLDDRTLWGASVETPLFGGTPKFKESFKYNLLSVPEETTPKINFLSEVFKLVVSKLGQNSGNVAMVFSEAESFVRYFEMPVIPESEMRQAVGFEAQKYLPFALRDLYYGFRLFPNPNPETKKQGVLLGAAKKESVDLWKQAAAHAGYLLDFVEPEGVAFFEAMHGTAPPGAVSSEADVYAGLRQNGFLTFIAARGDEMLTSHMAKIPPPLAIVGQEPKKIDGEAVARQVSLLLNYFTKTFRGVKVRDLRMTVDPGSVDGNLETILKAQLELPVRIVSRPKLLAGAPETLTHAEMIAAAAARSRVKSVFLRAPKTINLITAAKEKKSFFSAAPLTWDQEKKELKRFVVTEALALAAIFLLIHLFFAGKIGESRNKLIASRGRISAFQTGAINPDADLDAASASLLGKASFLSSVFGKRVYWTPKLSEIARLLPAGTELDVLEI